MGSGSRVARLPLQGCTATGMITLNLFKVHAANMLQIDFLD